MNDHAVFDTNEQTFHCLKCGSRYAPALPCPLTMFARMAEAFSEAHHGCGGDCADDLDLTTLRVTTRYPTSYVLTNEADRTKWRGSHDGQWIREQG